MKKIIVFLAMLSLLALPLVTNAETIDADMLGLGETNGNGQGAAAIGLGQQDLMTTINAIISVLLSFLGILAVIIILWGGFLWMTAMGDDAKVDKAKKLIIAGIIGIVIILSAYAIAKFVIESAINSTTTTL